MIKPLVEDYFAWVKEMLSDTAVLPKGKTADGLKYSLNQEKYLKVFLDHPDVPIDNSASERAIRTFCLGKKNWMFHNTANGAHSSALVYSISETAKRNNLRPYYYFRYTMMKRFKLVDMREQYSDIIAEAESEQLDYMDFLIRLLSVEEEGKNARRQEMLLEKANFDRFSSLSEIDYSFNHSLDKDKIEELGKLHFLQKQENIIIIGPGRKF